MADNVQVQLARQPEGVPRATDFQVTKTARPSAGAGQFLIRNMYLSLDPYQRGAIAGRHMGHTRLNQGDVIYGRCLGEVIESKHPDYKVGEIVVSESGWQQFYVASGSAHDEVRKVKPDAPLSSYLGVLGMPGLTAWAGVEKLAQPKLGDTFVVSSAAGPVGGTAGQLAKAKGCRVVGIAGGDEKCKTVIEKYGFDDCINYKNKDWPERLKAACPNGINHYYDNVGGPMLDTLLTQLALYGKVIMCGLASMYNRTDGDTWTGNNMGPVVGKRAQLLGLVVYDYYDKFPEFQKIGARLMKQGKLVTHEDRVDGLENAPTHFVKLASGLNNGKALVAIAPEKI